jgi:hypothetical protein
MKKNVIAFLVVCLFFLTIKSCIITTANFKDYFLLELVDSVEQNRTIITPDNEMIIVKRYQANEEIAIYKIRGEEATHYFGGLYNISNLYSGNSGYDFQNPLFGIRYYSGAQKVYITTLEVTKKIGESFPDIGKKFNARIIIYKDKLKIGNYEYKILPLKEVEKADFKKMIEAIKIQL